MYSIGSLFFERSETFSRNISTSFAKYVKETDTGLQQKEGPVEYW
jgi:hypothetical protein